MIQMSCNYKMMRSCIDALTIRYWDPCDHLWPTFPNARKCTELVRIKRMRAKFEQLQFEWGGMEPLAKRLGRSLEQIKQSVGEKMGIATDGTEFPLTFIQLDDKAEAIRDVYDSLYRMNRQALRSDNYGTPETAIPPFPPLQNPHLRDSQGCNDETLRPHQQSHRRHLN